MAIKAWPSCHERKLRQDFGQYIRDHLHKLLKVLNEYRSSLSILNWKINKLYTSSKNC